MPFSDTDSLAEEKWTEVFNHIIKAAVEESGFGYECKRYGLGRANIVKDILEDLNRAQVVIADLTDNNANVLWELGVRHTLKRRTILISQDKKFIPSDLKDYPVILYGQTKTAYDKFKNDIQDKLKDIETNPDKPDSPVADFLLLKNIDLLAYEKSQNYKKLTALLSEVFFNIGEIDNIEKQLDQNIPPYSRLQNTCMKLILSTRYINVTPKVLYDISLCDRMADILNQQLDFTHQSLIMDLEELPKKLKRLVQPTKGNFISLLSSLIEIRANFANDNYQESKEPAILLPSPEYEKYLEIIK